MRRAGYLLALACAACGGGPSAETELARWERTADHVTIVRDDWGIPHIHGRTDAEAVFGLIYAQAEDDFHRIETNFLNAMGRLAEAEGDTAVYQDLRMRMFIHPDSMKAWYSTSPDWLKALMNAWADGLNFFLHENPDVKPRVLTRFEPWMALTFSEGSIGGDIESIQLRRLRAFYGDSSGSAPEPEAGGGDAEPRGSNGIAIAPSNTAGGHALLLINPHTSFFFRAEVQVTSEEGLNAYGAVTWGQFFVYQGFNETAGWMHTSSNLDNIDEYLETIVERPDGRYYRYGTELRAITIDTVTILSRADTGMARRSFPVYRTHHGPVVRAEGGKWVTVRLMQDPVTALTQSYSRTKAKNYREFRETMELRTNSSNNTLFADAEGNIAYFHANFIPKRDARLDWTKPVDGSDPATEWQGLHGVDEAPNVLNPSTGWVYNTNNWPYSAAGADSPRPADFPRYMESGGENARGLHAIRVLEGKTGFTLDGLVAAAYDSYLTAFEELIPALLNAYDRSGASHPGRAALAGQIALLRAWDLRWSVGSEATTLAIAWGDEMSRRARSAARRAGIPEDEYIARRTSPAERLEALAAATAMLVADHGTWKVPWGEVNRFQRLTGAIQPTFSDSAPSIPVGFTSARWGSLASFGARRYPGVKKLYGTSGNSFVAVVEFGDSVRARAVSAGGESGDPASPHFNDQAVRYSTGDLRDVYFYRPQLTGHIERQYHPGE